MTLPLARRLNRLEEARRRPIRDRLLRICRRFGVELPPAEVETLVARHVGTPARIDRMRRDGLTNDEIIARLTSEIPVGEAG
jgi:hypothetical protein